MEEDGNHIIGCLGRTYRVVYSDYFVNSSNHPRESALFCSLSADEDVKV